MHMMDFRMAEDWICRIIIRLVNCPSLNLAIKDCRINDCSLARNHWLDISVISYYKINFKQSFTLLFIHSGENILKYISKIVRSFHRDPTIIISVKSVWIIYYWSHNPFTLWFFLRCRSIKIYFIIIHRTQMLIRRWKMLA